MIYATANGATHATLTKCANMQKDEENPAKQSPQQKDVVVVVPNANGDCVAASAGAATAAVTTTTTTSVAAGDDQHHHQQTPPPRSAYAHGGRLKFFKDGKFILELERSREGERVSWVSVPRKTFWPPQGTASSTPTYRQESSTSLSVSDDNSSIQSSPWQRDHSWKQTTPCKNLSRQLAFYYVGARTVRRTLQKSRKTRKPHDPTPEDHVRHPHAATRKSPSPTASAAGASPRHAAAGTPPRSASSPKSSAASYTSRATSKKKRKEKRLHGVIQILVDKLPPTGSPARDPTPATVVSPRKRFLREMDKDAKAHVDDACLKRSRGKQPTTSSVSSRMVGSPVRTNGVAAAATTIGAGMVDATTVEVSHHAPPPPPASTPTRTQPRNSSYSITSLLADDKTIRRSPAHSPSHYSPSAVTAAGHPFSTPTPEDRWYAESVDRLRSIELSHVDKRLCLPYATPPSFMPPFMHPYTLPPHYFHAFARGFPGLTAAAAAAAAAAASAPPACLLPPQVRPEAPSCSWAAEPPRDQRTQDDNIADMPLNLSKHAG